MKYSVLRMEQSRQNLPMVFIPLLRGILSERGVPMKLYVLGVWVSFLSCGIETESEKKFYKDGQEVTPRKQEAREASLVTESEEPIFIMNDTERDQFKKAYPLRKFKEFKGPYFQKSLDEMAYFIQKQPVFLQRPTKEEEDPLFGCGESLAKEAPFTWHKSQNKQVLGLIAKISPCGRALYESLKDNQGLFKENHELKHVYGQLRFVIEQSGSSESLKFKRFESLLREGPSGEFYMNKQVIVGFIVYDGVTYTRHELMEFDISSKEDGSSCIVEGQGAMPTCQRFFGLSYAVKEGSAQEVEQSAALPLNFQTTVFVDYKDITLSSTSPYFEKGTASYDYNGHKGQLLYQNEEWPLWELEWEGVKEQGTFQFGAMTFTRNNSSNTPLPSETPLESSDFDFSKVKPYLPSGSYDFGFYLVFNMETLSEGEKKNLKIFTKGPGEKDFVEEKGMALMVLFNMDVEYYLEYAGEKSEVYKLSYLIERKTYESMIPLEIKGKNLDLYYSHTQCGDLSLKGFPMQITFTDETRVGYLGKLLLPYAQKPEDDIKIDSTLIVYAQKEGSLQPLKNFNLKCSIKKSVWEWELPFQKHFTLNCEGLEPMEASCDLQPSAGMIKGDKINPTP